MQQRMPASVTISLAIHAGFLVLFLGVFKEAPKQASRIVEGVDLLIAPARPKPAAGVPKPKISTMDFLKMALPAAPPRRAALQAVDIKVPDRKTVLAEAPKLEDSTRRLAPKLDALDLERSRVEMAKIDVTPKSRRQAAATLAALPRLEDVGRRRVKNLPEALVLEERRREATAIVGGGLDVPRPTSRREVMAAAAVLAEAEPPIARPSTRAGFSVLPEQIELRPRAQAVMAARMDKIEASPKLVRRQAAAATDAPKKGVEIEGPLANRKVVSSEVPAFPEWARTQGLLEAEVAIRFTVDAEGRVMSGLRVERTSGYGRLDRLVMESLRNWIFAPAPGTGAQWGVITFRFLLE